jgi:predicted hydrocarbon binding protein
MESENDLAVANAHFRQTLIAIRQVLGENGTKDIYQRAKLDSKLSTLPPDDFDHSFDVQDFSRLLHTIELTYGDRGPRILNRIGRESFHVVLRERPSWMGTAKRVMRLWSPEQRIGFMLEAIIDTQRKTYPNSEIWLEEKDGQVSYIEQNCVLCHGRKSQHPICYLMTGFIREAINWVTEKEFEVQETACIGTGDAYCRFSIVTTKSQSRTN